MNPIYLVALVCPIGMGLMMLFMGKGMMGMGKGGANHAETPTLSGESADPEKRLAVLQAQRALIDAQMAAMTSAAEGDDPGSDRTANISRR